MSDDKLRYSNQCPNCRGAGYTSAKLLMSKAALQRINQLAKILPKEPVPIEKQWCQHCDGTGRVA